MRHRENLCECWAKEPNVYIYELDTLNAVSKNWNLKPVLRPYFLFPSVFDENINTGRREWLRKFQNNTKISW
jgi:hypothetical protein